MELTRRTHSQHANVLRLVVTITMVILGFSVAVRTTNGQSTSNWISIKGVNDAGEQIDPATSPRIKLNSAYVSIALVNTRIYQKSRWYSDWVERDRKLVQSIDVTGAVSNQLISDARTSPRFEMRRGNSPSWDTGWGITLLENVPSTFNNLQLRLRVAKTAKNGLTELLDAASAVSQNSPLFAVSPAVSAYIGAAKVLSEFMFNGALIQAKIDSSKGIDTGGDGFVSGYYVIFAGDTGADYQNYVSNPDNLKWNKSELQFTSTGSGTTGQTAGVQNVTYIVVRVRAATDYFPDKISAPLSSGRPWAGLYMKGRLLVSTLNATNEFDKVRGQIEALFNDAKTILDTDSSLIDNERTDIHQQISHDTCEKLVARMKQLGGTPPVTCPSAVPARTPASPRPTSSPTPIPSPSPSP